MNKQNQYKTKPVTCTNAESHPILNSHVPGDLFPGTNLHVKTSSKP